VCATYQENELDLGDLGGIPGVLDAGQCNDSSSLVVAVIYFLALRLGTKIHIPDPHLRPSWIPMS